MARGVVRSAKETKVSLAMNKFKVLVTGKNCLIRMDEEPPRKFGFYTTAFVEAPNAEHAEAVAIELLRSDPKLRNACENDASDPPVIRAEFIDEIASFDGCKLPRTGLALFEESA
jgi:hypothetical protein